MKLEEIAWIIVVTTLILMSILASIAVTDGTVMDMGRAL